MQSHVEILRCLFPRDVLLFLNIKEDWDLWICFNMERRSGGSGIFAGNVERDFFMCWCVTSMVMPRMLTWADMRP